MYNNIGLRTPRGSGTNGYIQRNVAFISKPRQEFIVGLKTKRNQRHVPKPNKLRVDNSIMEHNKKKQIEILVCKQRCKYEDEGKTEQEIETLTNKYRQQLLTQIENGIDVSNNQKKYEDSHQRTQQKLAKNEQMRAALGLTENEEGNIIDEKQLERAERRKQIEEQLSEKEKIKYQMQRINKHPLDHSHSFKKRKRNHSDVSSSDSHSDSDSDSDSDSSDDEYDHKKRRKSSRDKRKRSVDKDDRDRYSHGRKHSRHDRDRDREYNHRRDRDRRDSHRRHRSRTRSRSRSRSKESNRGRWGDDRYQSESVSPRRNKHAFKSSDNRIVPDFQ